jgi:hypothetical protein
VAKATAKKKKSKPASKTVYSVVALSEKTGKAISPSAAKGKQIFYAVKKTKDGKSKITRIQSFDAQTFSKKDLEGLKKSVVEGRGKFIAYEQITGKSRKVAGEVVYKTYKDKKGVVKHRLDKNKKKIPLKQTKLTFGKVGALQRPVLFKGGKRVHATDLGFRSRGKRQIVDNRLLTVLPLSTAKRIHKATITLKGQTIHENVRRIVHGITIKGLKRAGYTGIHAHGEIRIKRKGEKDFVLPISTKTTTPVNLSTAISTAIRRKLAQNDLYFTREADLEDVQDEERKDAKREKRPVKNLKMIGKHQKLLFNSMKDVRADGAKVTFTMQIKGYPPH